MKHALVTGGSGGIGSAICIRLATMGYNVIVHYNINKVAAINTLDAIKSEGGNGEIIQFNISNNLEVNKSLTNWKKNNPDKYISVLINNAGTSKDMLMVWMEDFSTSPVLLFL